ncbi:MAG: hypothetical protein AMXMBFR57_32680 [Acidimicrobiia bacterium]
MNEILERFDQLAQRFDQLEQKMDAGFGQVERRFEQVDQRFEKVDQRFEKVEGELAEGRERDRGLEARFDRLEGQLHKQGLLLESMNNDLKQTMEVVTVNREAMDRGFAEVMRKMDERVHPLELASRHFARQLPAAVKKRGRK